MLLSCNHILDDNVNLFNFLNIVVRYRWALVKILQFLSLKKPGMQLGGNLLTQFGDFQNDVMNDDIGFLSSNWETMCILILFE
jgi:hypothetical protein